MKEIKVITQLAFSMIAFLLLSCQLFAQRGPGFDQPEGQREKIQAHKIAYITDQVRFTPDEAQRFWPVYNENFEKMEAERKKFKSELKPKPEDFDKLTDEEAIEFLNAQLAHEQRMLDMQKEFDKKLLTVLPPQKILKLHKAEQDFRLELVRKLADRQEPPPGRE